MQVHTYLEKNALKECEIVQVVFFILRTGQYAILENYYFDYIIGLCWSNYAFLC